MRKRGAASPTSGAFACGFHGEHGRLLETGLRNPRGGISDRGDTTAAKALQDQRATDDQTGPEVAREASGQGS
jgi:hypothetical protein